MLWGAVWLTGYLLEVLGDKRADLFWAVVPALAAAVSFGLGFRMRHRLQGAWGRQLAGFWGLWLLFAAVWFTLFLPPTQPQGQAFLVSVVAFAISASGLLVSRVLVLAGLGLFAWDLLVYLQWPGLFSWAMMAAGAAVLMAGVWLVRWKPGSTS